MRAATASRCRGPSSTEPVKLIPSTSGDADQRLADRGAAPHHEIEHPRRDARAAARMSASAHAHPGHEVGRLEHDAVAVGEGGGDLPRRDREREVPGRDRSPTTPIGSRVISTDDAGADGVMSCSLLSHRLAGEELEDVARRALASPMPSASGLALLAGEQRAELVLARRRISSPVRSSRSARCCRFPRDQPGNAARAAAMAASRLRRVRARVLADHFLEVRRVDVAVDVGARHPFAVDQVSMERHGSSPSREIVRAGPRGRAVGATPRGTPRSLDISTSTSRLKRSPITQTATARPVES